MPGKSDTLENMILDHLFGAVALTLPAAWHFALFTVAPTDAGGGTEVSGGAYARVSVTRNQTNFPAAANGSMKNATAITFPAATAAWGTIVAIGIYDAATLGNLRFWQSLTTSRVVNSGDTFSIPANSLTLTED